MSCQRAQASKADPAAALKEGGAGRIGGRSRQRARRSLVAIQLTLAVALMMAAGVLVRSFARLYSVDPGIDPEPVLTLRLTPSQARYPGFPELVRFYESAADRVRSIPGVVAVLGKRLRVWVPWPWMEIIGIVRDVRHYGLERNADPAWYVPHAQSYVTAYTSFYPMTLVVRTERKSGFVRS